MKKKVRILSNDPVKRSIVITLKAQVEFVYNFEPVYLSFGVVSKKQLSTKRYVTVKTREGLDLEISELSCDNPHISVEEVRNETQQIRLRVSLKESLPIGVFNGTVTVRTNNADKPFSTFKVSGHRLGLISAHPDKILFHQNQRFDSVTKTLTLMHEEDKSFKILKMVIAKPSNYERIVKSLSRSNPDIRILDPVSSDLKWEEDSGDTSGGSIKIKLTFKRKLDEGDVVYGSATFLTDDPEHKEISITYYGYSGNFNPLQHRIKRSDSSQKPAKPVSRPVNTTRSW